MHQIYLSVKETSTEELEKLNKVVQEELAKRKDQRKSELWGNVVAAIHKYEEEIGDITFTSLLADFGISSIPNVPGKIYLQY